MTKDLEALERNLERVAQSVALARWLSEQSPLSAAPADVLRAALASAVSSLDAYVHGMVDRAAFKMVELGHAATGLTPIRGRGELSVGLSQLADLYSVAISADAHPMRAVEANQSVAVAISVATRRLTFQSPDEIGRAFASVGVRKVWNDAFAGVTTQLSESLRAACDRRNKIVHEADLDYCVLPPSPRTITPEEVEQVGNLIRDIAHGLDRHLTTTYPVVFGAPY